MQIYIVRFSETGKPVGNPLHRDPVEAAWHVRENGVDKTDVLQISSTEGVCIQGYVQQTRIFGRDFLGGYRKQLEARDEQLLSDYDAGRYITSPL